MERIEQLQQTAKEAQDKVRAAEQVFTKEKQVLDELESRLSVELAELESQQRDRSGKVEPGLLARYTKLKAARKDQPLAAIKGGMEPIKPIWRSIIPTLSWRSAHVLMTG